MGFTDFFSYLFKRNRAVVEGRIPPPPPTPPVSIGQPEYALRLSTVYACVRILAETIACLPKRVYDSATKEEVPGHPMEYVIDFAPNEYTDAVNFWVFIINCVLLRGNGVAAIERSTGGQVRLIQVDSTEFSVRLAVDPASGRYVKVYSVRGKELLDADVLHFQGSAPSTDGLIAVSVIQRYAMNTLQHAQGIEDYVSEAFRKGTNISGAVEVATSLSPQKREAMRKEIDALHSGMSSGGRLAIIDEGAKISAIELTPDDEKFIASRNFSIEEICRWFGVPLHLVQNGNQQSYNSNESNGASFQTYTLLPLCKRIEQQINRKLFPARDYYVAFDFSSLLRPAWKDLIAALVQATGGPIMSKNEGRQILNLKKTEGGDTITTPLNMGPTPTGGNNAAQA